MPLSAIRSRGALSEPKEAKTARKQPRNGKRADVGDRLQSLFTEIVQDTAPLLDADAVRSIVDDTVGDRLTDIQTAIDEKLADFKAPKPDRFIVQIADVEREVPESAHKCFGALLKLALAKNRNGTRFNVLLVGPAGCGKTYAAEQVATALDLRFGFLSLSAGVSECHLIGRYLPTGAGGQFEYTESAFVDFYRNGGVFLLDELDAADPNVLIIINAALANGHLRLPNGDSVDRHPDFVCIAAANTYGNGADRQYVGRAQLDAATLDRFAATRLNVDYDEDLERTAGREDVAEWPQNLRRRVRENGLRRIVSTRFILDASDLVDSGACTLDEAKRSLLLDWSDSDLSTVQEPRP